ncbi:MAG: glycosyltransferase [Chlorobiaceae bacterium]|nr:glycosyltransferase [Chlorobiaceae bacterium]
MSISERSSWSISVVMAVYNPDLSFIEKAVRSVLEQSIPVKELLLVNDGGCGEYTRRLPDDSRIRLFAKRNEGVAKARNFAIAECRGEYIAFLDQDDYWYPYKLQEQVAMIGARGERCMVTSPVDVVDASGALIRKKSKAVQDMYFLKASKGNTLLSLADENFVYSSTPLVHGEVFKKTGGFDASVQPHDDWDMYMRIALAGYPIYFPVERPLSVWRVHAANESQNVAAMLLSKFRVEQKLLGLVGDQAVKRVLQANLSIDTLKRDNLVYNEKDYCRFRKAVFPDMLKVLEEYAVERGDPVFERRFKHRVRKTVLKSCRRFLLSFFQSHR